MFTFLTKVLALFVLSTTLALAALPTEVVFPIYGDKGSCSGVMIAPHHMLTAAHCKAVGDDIKVDGKPAYKLKVGNLHNDFMLLLVEKDCPCIDIAKVAPVRGDVVYIVGFPLGLNVQVVTSGPVQGYIGGTWKNIERGFMLATVHGWPGESGGGIFQLVNGQWVLVSIVHGGVEGLSMSPSTQMLNNFLNK